MNPIMPLTPLSPMGFLQAGSKYPYLIYYTFDKFTSVAAARYIVNEGKGDAPYDAEMFSSNHLYLNGTNQSVDYPIIHELGSEITVNGDFNGNIDHWGQSSGPVGVMEYDSTKGAFHLTSGADPKWVHNDCLVQKDKTYVITCTIEVVTGEVGILVGNWQSEKKVSTSGTYNLEWTMLNDFSTTSIFHMAADANAECYVYSVSIKEVSIPFNSHRTMYNSDTKQLEQLDHTQLPISTVEKVDVSHQCWFNHTKTLTQAELDQLNNEPELIVAVYRDGKVLVDGFSKADIGEFLLPVEGDNLFNHIGSSYVYNQDFVPYIPTNIAFTATESNTINVINDYEFECEIPSDSGILYFKYYLDYSPSDMMLATVRIDVEYGSPYLQNMICGKENGSSNYIFVDKNITGSNTYSFISYAANYIGLTINFNPSRTPQNTKFKMYVELRKVTNFYEIQNYTDSVRNNLVNQNYGIQNLLLTQDIPGIPTGTATQGTIVGSDDGRYIEIPDVPTDYIITECTETIYGDDSTALDVVPCGALVDANGNFITDENGNHITGE